MSRVRVLRRYLMSLWGSVLDGVGGINASRGRSVLRVGGVGRGGASVVAAVGRIAGGRRKGQEFWDKTGGVRKMFIRELDARETKQNAQGKKSKGLTYDDALALQREASLIELVEPTMERQELVKTPGFEKRMDVSGATPNYEPMYDFHPAAGRCPMPEARGG